MNTVACFGNTKSNGMKGMCGIELNHPIPTPTAWRVTARGGAKRNPGTPAAHRSRPNGADGGATRRIAPNTPIPTPRAWKATARGEAKRNPGIPHANRPRPNGADGGLGQTVRLGGAEIPCAPLGLGICVVIGPRRCSDSDPGLHAGLSQIAPLGLGMCFVHGPRALPHKR
jgi:hypothetical protein